MAIHELVKRQCAIKHYEQGYDYVVNKIIPKLNLTNEQLQLLDRLLNDNGLNTLKIFTGVSDLVKEN